MRSPLRDSGVRLPDGRDLARGRPIDNAPLPATCVIAMAQDSGPPAQCRVSVGDLVAEGDLVGQAVLVGSTNVHAPVPGRVAGIRDIATPLGGTTPAVVIELEGRFARSGKPPRIRDWQRLDAQAVRACLKDRGVLGLCGEGFPTRRIWEERPHTRPEYLVVNGVEPEPYLTGGHRLLLERTARVISAIRIVERWVEPAQVIVVLESAETDLGAHVGREIARQGLEYRVHPVEAPYPMGQPEYLLEAVTGRRLEHTHTDVDIGCVLVGIDTLNALYEAVVFDQPLVERVVTVTGAVARPANLKARIGTPVRELIEECGGLTRDAARVVLGGPMRGMALGDRDTPLTKGVRGIVALPRSESRGGRGTPCISCGSCIRVCPEDLSPLHLHKLVTQGRIDDAVADGLEQCTECGCCAYVCPSKIELVRSIRAGKTRARVGGRRW